MKRLWIAAPALLALAACGSDSSRIDAQDVPGHAVDRTAPQVIAFSNHYPDVETKCDGHGHRIFVGTHDSAVGRNIIVIADPSCPGFQRGTQAGVDGGGG